MKNYSIIVSGYIKNDPVDITQNVSYWEIITGARTVITSRDVNNSHTIISKCFHSNFKLDAINDLKALSFLTNQTHLRYIDFQFDLISIKFIRPEVVYFGNNSYLGFSGYTIEYYNKIFGM